EGAEEETVTPGNASESSPASTITVTLPIEAVRLAKRVMAWLPAGDEVDRAYTDIVCALGDLVDAAEVEEVTHG
ncbi:MAG TPA: hypothetical protein VMN39_07625, partial [Longimicrobiaceae bacterium]|nr:hypothetical protein [Longimicrobiaceae bacterium]